MKKLRWIFVLTLAFSFINNSTAYAKLGDMGFFGGISEGARLPKTTEIILQQTKKSGNTKPVDTVLNYKEVVFLGGRPVTVEGMLTVKYSGTVVDTADSGTYNETYTITPNAGADASLSRNIVFRVNWRREGQQIIKDYDVRTWTESITVPDGSFTVDNNRSHYGISVIEDHTPGVVYYKGTISQQAVYTGGGADAGATTLDITGSFYGYNCAWSSAEVHRLNGTVINDGWQMQYQVRPSVTVNKMIQYDKNEPTAISFDGNYREVMQNVSGLEYNIFTKPQIFYDMDDSGMVNISSYNTFEQLPAPRMDYLKSHLAEEDIRKLFSMGILEGDPKFFQPSQAVTRGQYVTMLVKAINLPVEEPVTKRTGSRTPVVTIVFPDVTPDRPDYKYIMAAYKSGLALGRDKGLFYVDSAIDMQEAIVILLRTLGLENLGLDPTPMTSFTDDYKIASWAKKEIYAANRIGLIDGDSDGNIRPDAFLSKADAAALVNRLVDYMRHDLSLDYTEHIVNYAD